MKLLTGARVAISLLAITGVLNAAADELGLVAHWPLDEGAGPVARDTSGNGNDGKLLGAQWVKVPGGHALEFDGLNSYVDCGDNPSLDLRGPVTTMAWVCPAGVQPAKEPGIYGKQFSSYLITYYLNRKLYWYINSGGNSTSASVPPSLWSHIATTFDGKLLRIYVNGVLRGQAISQSARVNAGRKFYLGCVFGHVEATDPNSQQTGAFKGMIDDVRIYNRALCEEEIRAQCKATDGNRNTMFAAACRPVLRGETIHSGPVSVCAGRDGAVQISHGRSFCVWESQFSYPGEKIGWHDVGSGPLKREQGGGDRTEALDHKHWSPTVKELDSMTLQIAAAGAHYTFTRTVRLRNGRVECEDTLANRTAAPVGILVAHSLTAPENFANARAGTTADNPLVFASQEHGDFGLLGEDDISRLQFDAVCIANRITLRHSSFALDAGQSHTFRYAIYPLPPAGDPYALINRVRDDWQSNFTIVGPWDWLDLTSPKLKDPVALKQHLDRRQLAVVALSPWLDYDPGSMDQVLPRAEYQAMVFDAAKRIREARPGIKIIGCIETDWVTLFPEKIREGPLLHTGTPEQVTQIVTEANLPWSDSAKRDRNGHISLERYTRGGKPQVALAVYPRPGNAQETFLLDQVRFLIGDCGLDGFYIDEFSQAWGGSIRDYSGWDGTSVDLDPATGKIAGKWINCSLTGISSRVQILNAGLARGKNVTCNTWSTSAAEQALPAQRFWEMQPYANPSGFVPGKKPPFVYEMSEGLLGSPIGLGATESKDKPLSEGLMLALIFYLRHGLLYYHYSYPELPENGPGNGEYGPINHSFPFTPVALHEGWMEGKERTITCLSGKYSWKQKIKPVVRVFGLDGREMTSKATLKETKKGWSVELKLADWAEICIISGD